MRSGVLRGENGDRRRILRTYLGRQRAWEARAPKVSPSAGKCSVSIGRRRAMPAIVCASLPNCPGSHPEMACSAGADRPRRIGARRRQRRPRFTGNFQIPHNAPSPRAQEKSETSPSCCRVSLGHGWRSGGFVHNCVLARVAGHFSPNPGRPHFRHGLVLRPAWTRPAGESRCAAQT